MAIEAGLRVKKRRRTWLLFLAMFLVCAFLVWLFWKDLERVWRPERPAPEEKILEEERKQLEEILRKRAR